MPKLFEVWLSCSQCPYLKSSVQESSILRETSVLQLLLAEPIQTVLYIFVIDEDVSLGSCKRSHDERCQPKTNKRSLIPHLSLVFCCRVNKEWPLLDLYGEQFRTDRTSQFTRNAHRNSCSRS